MKFSHNLFFSLLILLSFSDCLDAALEWRMAKQAGTTIHFTSPDSLLPVAIFTIQRNTLSELETLLGQVTLTPFSYYIVP
ncbi:hypothetical protein KAH55_14000, partial [bacterium]|nr:hypothetical protein [bacterium]